MLKLTTIKRYRKLQTQFELLKQKENNLFWPKKKKKKRKRKSFNLEKFQIIFNSNRIIKYHKKEKAPKSLKAP